MAGTDLLRLLDDGHAFDPVALPGHRSALYVPFDDLAAGEHETRIGRDVRNVQRIALAGTIGSGKSSMIEYALSGCDDVAPIWIDATHESTEVLIEPREFARQLIRAVVAWARAARTMSEDERREALLESSRTLPVRTRREKESFSLRLALTWLAPGWSREVEQTVADPELERSAEDFVDSLDRLIELVRGRLERVPVVVIDDSDRWLRFERGDRERLIEAFFTRTCRMLAERNWALVVAVHPEYAAASGFRRAAANGFLNVHMDVPALGDAGLIERIFDVRVRRVAAAAEELDLLETGVSAGAVREASAGDVFEPGFADALFDYYRATDQNVRSVLTVAEQAVKEAIGRGESIVSVAAVREAALANSQ